MKPIIRLMALLCCAGVGPSRATDRPNIPWLLAGDMGPEALSRSGTPEAKTPVIDQLAREGAYYPSAYTTIPVCSPSRSAFMAGMYAITIGAHNHRTKNKQPLPEGVRPLPAWLRDAGYFTANVVTFLEAAGRKASGKTDWNFKTQEVPFDGKDWAELKTCQPFYAQVNFSETHRDFHGPVGADPAKVVLPPYYPDHPVARRDWADYLDSARELDRKVGRILTQLEADGLAANTIVVLIPIPEFLGRPFMPEEELYDPAADPHEINNLAGSSEAAPKAALLKLRAAVTAWIRESGDRGAPPANNSALPHAPQ